MISSPPAAPKIFSRQKQSSPGCQSTRQRHSHRIWVAESQGAQLPACASSAAAHSRADDSDAIQQALDKARDKTGHGMVFLPSGTYRISRTLIVPAGVRIYGVGATRPPPCARVRGAA